VIEDEDEGGGTEGETSVQQKYSVTSAILGL
jgi:hypothetical protein